MVEAMKTSKGGELVAALSSILLYAFCSISMSFINKAALLVYKVPHTLVLLQMVCGVFIALALRQSGVVSFPTFTLVKASRLLPVTLCYTANVAFGLLSLITLNIPMYNALKRLTPVTVLIVKSCLTKTLPDWRVACSVVFIVSGCIVAAYGDLKFDLYGYLYALLSCVLQSLYLLMVEQTGVDKETTSTELLYYNSLLSIPFLGLIIMATGEAFQAQPLYLQAAVRVGDIALMLLLLSFGLMGVLFNFSLFWCTQLVSALTVTIIGVMKGVVSTVLGFFFLTGGETFTPMKISGIGINMVGGIWYTIVKYNQRRSRMERQPSLTPVNDRDAESGSNAAPKNTWAEVPSETTPLIMKTGGDGKHH